MKKNKTYTDDSGFSKFVSQNEVLPTSSKQWWRGEVTVSVSDGKTDKRIRKTQYAEVYCTEADAIGKVLSQCPLPWNVGEFDDIKTKVKVYKL